MANLTETKWFSDLLEGIYGHRKGGAKIIIDAEDASTGVGKTGLAVSIAEILAGIFDYDITEDDLTLSGAKYLERWREHPGKEQPSVIILDEMAGAGAGHSRRAMSTQNVELGNAWQLMRKKRIVTIVTLPHWTKVDKDMRQQADYRLWCLRKPIGYFRPYKIGSGFDSGSVNTTGYKDVSRISFPNLDKHDNSLYRDLERKKDRLLNSEYFDADKLKEEDEGDRMTADEAERATKIEIAQRMRDRGESGKQIADRLDMSDAWVYNNTESPQPAD